MKINKKLWFSFGALLTTPLTTLSCSLPRNTNFVEILDESCSLPWNTNFVEILDELNEKAKTFRTTKVFVPEQWLKDDVHIKTERVQKKEATRFAFNSFYFDNFPTEKKLGGIIKIETKEDFDEYIIKRFKELHSFDDFNEDSQIKDLFSRLYLNNNEVYEFLKNNTIFIIPYILTTWFGGIIPAYDENKIILYQISGAPRLNLPTVTPQSYLWSVFSIPKHMKIEIRRVANDLLSMDEYTSQVIEWYNTVYKKIYP